MYDKRVFHEIKSLKFLQYLLCVSIYTVSVSDTDLSQYHQAGRELGKKGSAVSEVRRSLDCCI